MDTNQELLARLLATENINVVQQNVNTASFDLKTRTLTLPLWQNMNKDTVDHLTGHEVGHALYTPEDEWGAALEDRSNSYRGYLNIVEDARIEKLIQRRYPGLRGPFIRSYRKLLADGFFGMDLEGINASPLIDRINAYFKCGGSAGVQFSKDERVWIDRIQSVETFQDAVIIATEMFDDAKQKKQEQLEQLQQLANQMRDEFGEDGDDEESEGDYGDGTEMDGDDGDIFGDEEGNQDQNDQPSGSSSSAGGSDSKEAGGGSTVENNEPEAPKTEQALREKIKQEFGGDSNVQILTVTTPSINGNDLVIPFKEILKTYNDVSQYSYSWQSNNNLSASEKLAKVGREQYDKFRAKSKKSIDYMVKEFEMRKRASEYSRQTLAKTGILDTVKMNNYMFSEDIFRRMTVVPEGKNHGFLMYIDWSGSMSSCLDHTIDQLVTLTTFCRQVKIPFRVYAFSNHYRDENRITQTPVDGEISISDVRLLELFNSSMTTLQYREMCYFIMGQAKKHKTYNLDCSYPGRMDLGGTPLCEAMIAARDIFHKFKKDTKSDIVSTFLLSDGFGGDLQYFRNHNGSFYSNYLNWNMNKKGINKLIDNQTKRVYRLLQSNRAGNDRNVQDDILKMYRDNTGSELIGYSIIRSASGYEYRATTNNYLSAYEMNEYRSRLRKEGYVSVPGAGYSKWFVMDAKKLKVESTDIGEVDENITKNKLRSVFKKAQGNRKGSRAMLSELIDMVA